jgi:hypothetical protein
VRDTSVAGGDTVCPIMFSGIATADQLHVFPLNTYYYGSLVPAILLLLVLELKICYQILKKTIEQYLNKCILYWLFDCKNIIHPLFVKIKIKDDSSLYEHYN